MRSSITTGRTSVGSAIEAASAGLSAPDENATCCAPVEIGRHDGERELERGEILRHRFGQELRAEFLGVDQRGAAETLA